MSYNIEIMAIGEDIYNGLNRAIAELNGVQNQFTFHLTQPNQRSLALNFRQSEYRTSDIWDFLRKQRKMFGGHRPYIIAFVNKPLQSKELRNIFGSHCGEEGLAVATSSNSAQYVKEITRYYCYFLVRYALSFVNPHIKLHNDENRKRCYFHKKLYKPEIRDFMDSGHICDDCIEKLQNPPLDHASAHKLSAEEGEALVKMRDYISGALPYAIVMKGGGVKGLAFAGALIELEKYFWFDRHVGTSVGALAAVLLAASYTPQELANLLQNKSFVDFKDAPWWKVPVNLLWSKGCYPGEACRLWIADLLTKKIPKLGEIPMSALNGALVYAAREGSGTLTFDSLGAHKDTNAAFAARCSMSIPFFFFPVTVDGRRVYDGGLRNNFPLTRFLAQEPRTNFIGLYLGKADNTNRRGWITPDLLNIAVEGEEKKTVDLHSDKVVIIDTNPIGTIDFKLNNLEKRFLLQVGKASALTFIQNRNIENGPSNEEVIEAHKEVKNMRFEIIQTRNRRRKTRIIAAVFFALAATSTYLYV